MATGAKNEDKGDQPVVTTQQTGTDPQTGGERQEPERKGREVKLGGSGDNAPTVTVDEEIADQVEGKEPKDKDADKSTDKAGGASSSGSGSKS